MNSKTIYLSGGSEESWEWRVRAEINRNGGVSAQFYTETSITNYRRDVRSGDRDWAERAFSRQFRQKYEIHHEWGRGETCYFLTKEEHKNVAV